MKIADANEEGFPCVQGCVPIKITKFKEEIQEPEIETYLCPSAGLVQGWLHYQNSTKLYLALNTIFTP